MKKNQPDQEESSQKQPRTELDTKFLAAVAQVMSKQGISSDRAMSLALGRSENFLNRVRNGYQSATPEAWSALFNKYPDAQNITNVTARGGQAVGTVQGDNYYAPTTLEACQQELEQHKRDLISARGEAEQLRLQLSAKDDIIAAKDALIASQAETLSLLRGGYTRPN